MPISLSVVLATYNRRPILEQTLDALAGQTRRDFRIVVVDDGSSDDTWPYLQARVDRDRGPELEIAHQENQGPGPARNRALRQVEQGLVLFLGDDVIPRPSFVAEHRAGHDRTPETAPPRAVVGFTDWCRSQVRVTPLLEMINNEGHQFGYAHMTPEEQVPFTCFYTSNVSLKREILGDDPFDPTFAGYGWEDVELGYRLSQRGLELYYHPAAAAEHLHPMTLEDVFERQRQAARGLHTLWRLHPELKGHPRLAPPEPPKWFRVGRYLIPPILPVVGAVDRRRIRLSKKFLHRVLQVAYYLGLEEGERSAEPAEEAA